MATPLTRVLVCSPDVSGWGDEPGSWEALGHLRPPQWNVADSEHRRLVEILEKADVEVDFLPSGDDLTLQCLGFDRGYQTILSPGPPS